VIDRAVIAAVLLAGLCSCSTVVEGKHQELTIKSEPAGADCAVNRKGVTIAHINPTPGTVTIEKTKYDITVVCKKDGYQTTSSFNQSGVTTATYGNILLGGLVGWGVDSATGSDNEYVAEVTVVLPLETQAN